MFDNTKGQRVQKKRTICEVHKEIYDLAVVNLQDRPEILKEVISKCEEAYLMGIKMNRKMVERGCATMIWKKNPKKLLDMRMLRRELEEREREVIANIQ